MSATSPTESPVTYTAGQATIVAREQRCEIVPRHPTFDFSGLPKYWDGGNPMRSFVNGMFSMLIPEGEKFFIRTVNALRHKVKDPQLQADIKMFTRQEAAHTKEHLAFNEALRAHGLDPDEVTERTRKYFAALERWLPKKAALAVTMFSEHTTALGAETEFRFPQLSEGRDPRAHQFWRWHAVEELEHKSVAHDVYEAAGGGYLTRIAVFPIIVITFNLYMKAMFRRQWKAFDATPTQEKRVSRRELEAKYPGLHAEIGAFAKAFVREYFKPGFHPWKRDSSQFVSKWKGEIEGTPLGDQMLSSS